MKKLFIIMACILLVGCSKNPDEYISEPISITQADDMFMSIGDDIYTHQDVLDVLLDYKLFFEPIIYNVIDEISSVEIPELDSATNDAIVKEIDIMLEDLNTSVDDPNRDFILNIHQFPKYDDLFKSIINIEKENALNKKFLNENIEVIIKNKKPILVALGFFADKKEEESLLKDMKAGLPKEELMEKYEGYQELIVTDTPDLLPPNVMEFLYSDESDVPTVLEFDQNNVITYTIDKDYNNFYDEVFNNLLSSNEIYEDSLSFYSSKYFIKIHHPDLQRIFDESVSFINTTK